MDKLTFANIEKSCRDPFFAEQNSSSQADFALERLEAETRSDLGFYQLDVTGYAQNSGEQRHFRSCLWKRDRSFRRIREE